MKKILTIITFLIALIVCGQQKRINITGVWSYGTPYTDFSIEIKQEKSNVEGNICSFMQNGNRIDCGDGTNFKGTLNEGVIIGYFKSFYGGGTGKATITVLPNGKLKWEITQRPKGDYYIPDKAILSKI